MQINGIEREFKLTVGAAAEISELCPNGDLDRLQELLTDASFGKTARIMAKIVVALNRGYQDSLDPRTQTADALTTREVLALDLPEFQKVVDTAMKQMRADQKGTVQITPKKNEGAADGTTL